MVETLALKWREARLDRALGNLLEPLSCRCPGAEEKHWMGARMEVRFGSLLSQNPVILVACITT